MSRGVRPSVACCMGISILALGAPALAEQQGPPASLPPQPAAASAAVTPAFGAKGQIVVTSALALSLGYWHQSSSHLFFNFAPSAHYFVAPELSVGLGVAIAQEPYDFRVATSNGSFVLVDAESTFGATAIVGYNVPLGKVVSLWLRLELGYYEHHYPKIVTPLGVAANNVNHTFTPEFFAPFLVHPAPHFFVGFGPYIWGDIVNKTGTFPQNRRYDVGAGSTVGGWF